VHSAQKSALIRVRSFLEESHAFLHVAASLEIDDQVSLDLDQIDLTGLGMEAGVRRESDVTRYSDRGDGHIAAEGA
jgi:hypothetical protein